ncbi:hypothetical protein RIF29_24820 [Crotalaria pallida]|uniref:Uncharacterized protein n=1 Tax=Crotalaria pallida TaxID=3830 RepID=A0AAN9EMP6_CROPI
MSTVLEVQSSATVVVEKVGVEMVVETPVEDAMPAKETKKDSVDATVNEAELEENLHDKGMGKGSGSKKGVEASVDMVDTTSRGCSHEGRKDGDIDMDASQMLLDSGQ